MAIPYQWDVCHCGELPQLIGKPNDDSETKFHAFSQPTHSGSRCLHLSVDSLIMRALSSAAKVYRKTALDNGVIDDRGNMSGLGYVGFGSGWEKPIMMKKKIVFLKCFKLRLVLLITCEPKFWDFSVSASSLHPPCQQSPSARSRLISTKRPTTGPTCRVVSRFPCASPDLNLPSPMFDTCGFIRRRCQQQLWCRLVHRYNPAQQLPEDHTFPVVHVQRKHQSHVWHLLPFPSKKIHQKSIYDLPLEFQLLRGLGPSARIRLVTHLPGRAPAFQYHHHHATNTERSTHKSKFDIQVQGCHS